jgi:hypothetical protein
MEPATMFVKLRGCGGLEVRVKSAEAGWRLID